MKKIKELLDKAINTLNGLEEDENDSVLDMERSLQLDKYTCGVQSAFSILKYYGKARSVQSVEEYLGPDEKVGTTETAIYRLFRDRKLKISKRDKANISTIKESIHEYESPMLTTINDYNHWVVVYGYSSTHIYVLDPVIFRPSVKWKKEKFKSAWDKWGAIIYK